MNKAPNDISDINVLIDRTKQKAAETIPPISPEDWEQVENLARTVARHSTKIAEALLDNSLYVLQQLGLEGLENISRLGIAISLNCGKTAVGIFQQCPKLLNRLAEHGNRETALDVYTLSHQLSQLSWKTAAGMLEAAPSIIERIGYPGLLQTTEIGLQIAPHCWLTALSHFEKSPKLLDRLLIYGNKEFVISVYHIIGQIARNNWQVAVFLLDNSPDLIGSIGFDGFKKVALYGDKIAKKNTLSALGMLEKCKSRIAEMLNYGEINLIMDVFDCFFQTANHCWQTSLHLFERSPELIEFLGYEGFYRIAEKACELSKIKKERAISFIKGESLESAEFMDGLTENLKLIAVKPVLSHYLNALLNYRVEIAPSNDHSTDGSKIFLPENICEFTKKKDNFILYKVYATHEEAHLEYGSFDFRLSEISDLVDAIKAKYGPS